MGNTPFKKGDLIVWNKRLAYDLQVLVRATDMTPKRLFESLLKDKVDGLNYDYFAGLLTGGRRKVSIPLIDSIHEVCFQEWPGVKDIYDRHKGQHRDGYVEIPQEIKDRIKAEIERTNVSVNKLLKIHNIKRIKASIIMANVSGNTKKGYIPNFEKVLELYESVGTYKGAKKSPVQRFKDDYEPITEEQLRKLRSVQGVLLPGKIFDLVPDQGRLESIDSTEIARWLQKGGRAKREHVERVLQACHEVMRDICKTFESD